MLVSNIKRYLSKAVTIGALAFFVLIFSTGRPFAADGTIKVYESTFNEFIDAVEPIKITGNYNLSFTINAGIFGTHTISLCNSSYSATVTGLSFDITSSAVTADGDVSASWCNVSFTSSELDATGDIYYSSSISSVVFDFTSASVKPCASITFPVVGTLNVCLPFSINIAPTLSIPPVYVGPALISYETGAGTSTLLMTPSNMALQKRDGYIEFTSDVSF